MSVASIIRSRTRHEHVRTEVIYTDFDLQTRQGYKRFLIAQASASLAVEQSLEKAGVADVVDDWPDRRRSHLIYDDLDELSIGAIRIQPPTSLGSWAEILGAVYVLEGSRLGGKVLRKQVFQSAPTRFLDAQGKPGAWRAFLAELETRLTGHQEIDLAVSAARGVFATYQAAGREAAEIPLEH
ncbi:biliverdin-producing heme oxygenase [Sphingomonas sp. NSE70-1]|uniref:Biliverdin-producing heme oxygenase n=1 Tax=Sphingomonas caseinilyticus TaxID=2908205 RepID=A0ABT0RRV1_9SPHN|nr:biliverdin-producing heme oxygenase [Sphingomonas caseinilyticus]MCL6697734.1 biliverdin-producing heme oxygenase [Sphingomonas caseinilyticus]